MEGETEITPGPGDDGTDLVGQIAQTIAAAMIESNAGLSSGRAELPTGDTLTVAVGIGRAGEWLHNSVVAQNDHDEDEPEADVE